MRGEFKPHVLGVDDGPFDKSQREPVTIIGVMMECPGLIESVAITEWPVDVDDATGRMTSWIRGLRCRTSLQALILGGITVTGLGVLDIDRLADAIERPVLVANRKDPAESRLADALVAAGLRERLAILERCPESVALAPGVHLAWSGCVREEAQRIFRATLAKSNMPEPLRVAHLFARALASGESRGRV